jgi:hypothetical protein
MLFLLAAQGGKATPIIECGRKFPRGNFLLQRLNAGYRIC